MRKFAALTVVCAVLAACHASIRSTLSTPPTPQQLAELWIQPEGERDLFWGVGGERLKPDPSATYKVLEVKRGGFSMPYINARGRPSYPR